MESKKIAVVTGANKGIGLEICKQLSSSSSSSHGVMVILTARDEGRGNEAIEKLKGSGASDVLFHQLDVADPSSVASFANFIKTQFGKLDILVNNAAIGGTMVDDHNITSIIKEEALELKEDGSVLGSVEVKYLTFRKLVEASEVTYERAEECLNINYYGMKRVTAALMPFLQQSKSPRIVNVSSHYGLLSNIPSESIKKTIREADEHTEERLDQVLQSYLNGLKEGKIEANVWPDSPTAYKLSKTAMNAYTRIVAKRYPEVCINCVAPGFVNTDMTYNMGTSPVEEGASVPVMLALRPDGGASGLLYDESGVISCE